MKRIGKALILTAVFLLLAMNVFADANEWNGYGLYNLNHADVDFVSEKTKLFLHDKLEVQSEYVIKNNTSENIELIVGMPFQNFSNITFMDKGNTIKSNTIMRTTITKLFGEQAGIVNLDKWKKISVWLEPNEMRAITIDYSKDGISATAEEPTTIKYFEDRELGTNAAVNYAELSVEISGYLPYNLIYAGGAEQAFVGSNEIQRWQFDKESIVPIELKYCDVWSNLLSEYKAKDDKVLRDIANSLTNKEYSKIIELSGGAMGSGSYVNDLWAVQMFCLEAYKFTNDFENYNLLYSKIDTSQITEKQLVNRLIYDKVMVLSFMGEHGEMKKVINTFLSGNPDNVFFNRMLKNMEGNIKNQSVDVPAKTDNKERNTFFIKIAGLFESGVKFLLNNILIVVLLIVLIVLIFIYLRRRKNRYRHRIRFK